ncbi:MAG: hypothetical protein QOD88_3766, partial [Mycobacterium sp.]|nr:hypothetical protein [Mycobacterium sp.]
MMSQAAFSMYSCAEAIILTAGDHQQGTLDHRIVPTENPGDDEIANPR